VGAAHNSTRAPLQTLIGTFWGYDGAKGIGTPPRLYNQAVRALAAVLGTTPAQNAKLFALINMGMADAGIFAWQIKYQYNVWRPVIGIREEPPVESGVTQTTLDGDPSWAPLGAPQTNRRAQLQTPNFPAYPSGHATFGTAAFRLADRFLSGEFPGKNIAETPFTLVSDEYNGASKGEDGAARPLLPRQMTLKKAIIENKASRIYLGVHWSMDADEGERVGEEVARLTFEKQLR
jgi:vanadium chloroperoxidase